jgi:hypothetical protein
VGGLSGEYAALGGLSGDWAALGFNGSMSIDRILSEEASDQQPLTPDQTSSHSFPPVSPRPVQRKRRKAEAAAAPPKAARLIGEASELGERVVVRTREVLGGEMPMPASAPEWVAARMLRQAGGRALLRVESPPNAPAALSLAMQACAARWVPLTAAGGEVLIRPLDPTVDAALLGSETDAPLFEFATGCPVEVEGEAGWEVGEVLGKSSRTGLYSVNIAPDDASPAERAAAPAAPPPRRTAHGVRQSALRLRCCYEGCRKHALLMQRPPADCDMCGRPLQHPMRSSWEYQARATPVLSYSHPSSLLEPPLFFLTATPFLF